LAGTFSTIVQDAILNPFDVIKQRMQTWQSLQRTYPTNWACAQSIYHNEGWKAFYVSYPVTLSMSIPFQSIHFATYETVSSMLNPTHVYAPWVHMTAGGVAGALAASLTTPLDVIKTMLQTKGDALHPQLRQLKGWKQACVFLYQVHGWSGFWKGLGPRVLTHVPATALCWSTYEYFKFLVDWASPSSDGN
ncbi:Fe(2+) transporter, partial [Coelomomyces lativittatus]